MPLISENGDPTKLKGKYAAMVVCWLLGNGCLFSWNSMLTIEDYYVTLFPLDLATSGKGGIGTYIGICFISGAFGVADAHVQGGMVGDLSYMLPEFIQVGFCGWLICVLFFAISAFFELLCVLLYAFVFPKLPIVKYYRSKAASEGSKTVSADLAAGGIYAEPVQEAEEDPKRLERLSTKELLFKNMDYALDMFLIYALTLSIFPGFLSEDTGSHSLGEWYALVLIAMYNVWDLIGRYIPLIKCMKLESRKGLTIAILSRFLLVPAFYFTAKYGDQGWMILLTSFLGLTNGYLTVCVLTSAPKGYKGPEQNALGNILVLFLLGGIFAGVTLDWLWLIGKGW
ncbi:hypothetical protein RHGRI_010071 [Rhododendron griersonianum]|uniref:Equilibrative nucleotide transporter 3-like n=1 Tax=Rhododendron griersonianum TaxID=479676 RepID=A0AAV6KH36_9ERIC|nr:hypothetical protein RHGRI_010071 [Rhododendron griersonianum]